MRYCDDLVLLSPDRRELEVWEHAIEAFLGEQLQLELNERRRLRPVSDGIDFLGFIVRPDYLLVRRRVVAALRQRLNQTELRLKRAGLRVGADERAVYPWPPAIVGDIHQWLNSYLGYLRRASTHRLLGRLRARYWWLAEYFVWRGWKVAPRYPPPRCALRFVDQLAWFRSRLPGHVLAIQTGAVWKVAGHPTMPDRPLPRPQANASPGDDMKLRRWRTAMARRLWASGTPIAWIAETGRRPGVIAERILVSRWSGRAVPATDAARRDAVSGERTSALICPEAGFMSAGSENGSYVSSVTLKKGG